MSGAGGVGVRRGRSNSGGRAGCGCGPGVAADAATAGAGASAERSAHSSASRAWLSNDVRNGAEQSERSSPSVRASFEIPRADVRRVRGRAAATPLAVAEAVDSPCTITSTRPSASADGSSSAAAAKRAPPTGSRTSRFARSSSGRVPAEKPAAAAQRATRPGSSCSA
eukprot:CAMPEP_0185389346 /NCGR_PEP_ID=MMETSP1364-20130426/70093_1 /TAXON_ID=38817 /ORGANISM="Gephyrocapsa oceanica, Strain RCC1303" /LENGTH=167 /DNA_ID=CAMNT_0027991293 /DNA_START=41 /DNA_END=541 /DNA_ORIENTATION=+